MQDMLDRWMPQASTTRPQASVPALMRPVQADDNVLERGVLERLGALRINGRPELLVRAISLYLVESPKLVQRLKQAASANDAPEIARCAHPLKSASANVGASALSRYCGELEASARRADTEEARRLSAKIEAEHGRVQSALSAEYELLSASEA
jgi:two-component system, sensor histidine kinase and response regulator